MSVDGHTTQMKKEDLDVNSLNKMDPFFGGLPSYTIGSCLYSFSVKEMIYNPKFQNINIVRMDLDFYASR